MFPTSSHVHDLPSTTSNRTTSSAVFHSTLPASRLSLIALYDCPLGNMPPLHIRFSHSPFRFANQLQKQFPLIPVQLALHVKLIASGFQFLRPHENTDW